MYIIIRRSLKNHFSNGNLKEILVAGTRAKKANIYIIQTVYSFSSLRCLSHIVFTLYLCKQDISLLSFHLIKTEKEIRKICQC